MQTAQNMSGSTTVSTPPPGAGSAATNTTTPANASAASAPPAFVPSAEQVRKAQVALMRFGLGPKTGTFGEFVSSTDPDIARKLCHAELDDYAEYISKKDHYDQQARTGSAFSGSRLSQARLAEFGAGVIAQSFGPHTASGSPRPKELTFDYCRSCLRSTELMNTVLYGEYIYRYDMLFRPKLGFVQRLVLFWSNHFSISREKGPGTGAFVGHYERSVIRKHVLGRFSDMLVETMMHPAMRNYLDNTDSGGFSVPTGTPPTRRPLANQNLAREILELHTMGTGNQYGQRIAYTQQDVEALSMILTGWNVNFQGHNSSMPNWEASFPDFGKPHFNQSMHHEGSYTLLGQTFSANGQQKGIDALQYLAGLNSTSLHLCTKLLRHFVCDNPSTTMVTRLNHVFQSTRGNLLAVSKALLNMREAWEEPFERIRPPYLWMASMSRALGLRASECMADNDFPLWERRLEPLNNGTWDRITPDGFPDRDSAWVDPSAMRIRTSLALQILLDAAKRRSVFSGHDPVPSSEEVSRTLPWVRKPWIARGDTYSDNQTISAMFLSPDYMTR